MKAMLLICAALLTCGFVVDTTATRREAAKMEKRWQKEARSSFDFRALHRFLERVVSEKKQFEDIDLTQAKLGLRWSFAGMALKSGDWLFTFRSKEDEFVFTYTYAEPKYLEIKCVRVAKDSFRLVEIRKDEWIILML